MSKQYNLFDAATDLEEAAGALEDTLSLLYLYEEHRENELRNISPDDPSGVGSLVNRQGMGLSLLRAIEGKLEELQPKLQEAANKGYATVRAETTVPEADSEDNREEWISSIMRGLSAANCRELRLVYHFLVGLTKGK